MAQQNKPTHFKTARVDRLKKLYSDEFSASRSAGRTTVYNTENYKSAKSIRDAMIKGVAEPRSVIEASRQLYSTNPVYASVIDYLANIYLWRYKVTPHKVFTKSKAKLKKKLKADEYNLLYSLMLEVVDGLSLETVFPALLTMLFVNGSVYFTTICDEDSIAIDTITLDPKFCRKVADTQFGTAIIQFNFAYFDSLGLDEDGIKEYLKAFPKEFARGYAKYKKDTSAGSWQILDPRFSTGILLNEAALPRYLYLYGGILDYEKYQDNELKRSDNLLKYIVVHKMPHFEDQLIFDVDEVDAIHKSLKRIVETGNEARLITTWGDVHVDRISESDTAENQILSKSYRAIFNNAGLNDNIFASETAEGVKLSLTRDKAVVWKYVQQVLGFYNITVNNWFDFKNLQANIDILPISLYNYNDDVRAYKDNATLGVGKLDYIVASGIKQKDISDQLFLEDFLGLNDIKPMQTSYTQTAEDRGEQETKKPTDDAAKKDADGNESTENEPSGNEDTSDVKEVEDAPSDEKFWKNFKRG